MADAREWLATANANFQAAISLAETKRWRSASSRAYYAAHNAAHAVLCHLDPSLAAAPRSVPHGELPARVWRQVKKFVGDGKAENVRVGLVEAYNIRIQADYKPLDTIDHDSFRDARASAREMLELARRLTQ